MKSSCHKVWILWSWASTLRSSHLALKFSLKLSWSDRKIFHCFGTKMKINPSKVSLQSWRVSLSTPQIHKLRLFGPLWHFLHFQGTIPSICHLHSISSPFIATSSILVSLSPRATARPWKVPLLNWMETRFNSAQLGSLLGARWFFPISYVKAETSWCMWDIQICFGSHEMNHGWSWSKHMNTCIAAMNKEVEAWEPVHKFDVDIKKRV